MSASTFSCQVCQKTFTGPEPYQQHLASERHKKKCGASVPFDALRWQPSISSASSSNLPPLQAAFSASTAVSKSVLQCIHCDIPRFKNISEACAHYESRGHKERKLAKLSAAPVPVRVAKPIKPKLVESTSDSLFEIKPILPPSILLCEAHEDFTEFCKRHGLYGPVGGKHARNHMRVS